MAIQADQTDSGNASSQNAGTPTAIPFYCHDLGHAEASSVARALKGPILTTGALVEEFEQRFAALLGRRHALAVTSCTGALHMSLLALGIGAGDEVITTPMTFVATAAAILQVGATPVFVDVEPETGNLDVERVAAAITPRTRAIIPVHLYGLMCDMRRLRAVADAHGLAIIEDAAHCIEGRRDDAVPGSLSNVACFSFYATKNLNCGEGGALVTDDSELYRKLKLLRLHGIDRDLAQRYASGSSDWDMVAMGWKYNMSNIEAALLLPQLQRLSQNYARRDRLAKLYRHHLETVPGIRLPATPEGAINAFHLFPVWISEGRRDEVRQRLRDRGIGCVVNYHPVHLTRYFRESFGYERGNFPEAERIGNETLSLPFYPSMPDAHVEAVAEALAEVLGSGLRADGRPTDRLERPVTVAAEPVPSISQVIASLIDHVPGFSDHDELMALYSLAVGTAGLGGDIVEVGSWCGRSTIVLALAARASNGRVHAIDLFPTREDWASNPDGSWSFTTQVHGRSVTAYSAQTVWAEPFLRAMMPVYDGGSILDQFLRNLERFNVRDLVSVNQGTAEDFAQRAPAGLRCRMGFIDGEHSFPAVSRDLAVIRRFAVAGTVVCFDDAFSGYYPGVDQAITDHVIASDDFDMRMQMTRKLFVARLASDKK